MILFKNLISLFGIEFNFNFGFGRRGDRNEETLPELKICYDVVKNKNPKKQKILKLLEMFDKWYCLPESKDFKVTVFNSKTGEHDEDKSKAVKLFLQDVKRNTWLRGMVERYVRSENVQEFVVENKLTKINEDLQIKYAKLYFCFMTIAKIFATRTVTQTPENLFIKVFYKDFHFVADLNNEKLKAYCKTAQKDYHALISLPYPIYALDLGYKIFLEDIMPGFYLSFGCRDDSFIEKNAELRRLENYQVAFND